MTLLVIRRCWLVEQIQPIRYKLPWACCGDSLSLVAAHWVAVVGQYSDLQQFPNTVGFSGQSIEHWSRLTAGPLAQGWLIAAVFDRSRSWCKVLHRLYSSEFLQTRAHNQLKSIAWLSEGRTTGGNRYQGVEPIRVCWLSWLTTVAIRKLLCCGFSASPDFLLLHLSPWLPYCNTPPQSGRRMLVKPSCPINLAKSGLGNSFVKPSATMSLVPMNSTLILITIDWLIDWLILSGYAQAKCPYEPS